jgi:large subunit ribosomal protein L4
MVRYQTLKRMAGTHHAQDRSEVAVTGKKMYKQKGTGGARHGDKSAPQFRGGGKAFGPKPRSHAVDMPKKVRALALRHALSAKAKAGEIIVLDKASSADGKTGSLPVQGINVYDILRRKKLVLTKAAVAALEARFK